MEIITACRQSGLSDFHWCRINGIPSSSFYNAARRLRRIINRLRLTPGHCQRWVATGKRTGGHWAAQNAISETDHHDINDVYSEMENEGYAGNTISGAYSAIHAYFRIAHLLGYVKENPAPLSKVIYPVK
jgi:hypothetical protein